MAKIIAEFCQNHKGDLKLLKEMIWAAKEAGADGSLQGGEPLLPSSGLSQLAVSALHDDPRGHPFGLHGCREAHRRPRRTVPAQEPV